MAKPEKILAQELLDLEVLDLAAGEVVGRIIDLALTRTGQVALVGVLPTSWFGGGKGIAPEKIASIHLKRACIEGSDSLEDFDPDGEGVFSMVADGLMPKKQVLQEDGELLGSLVDFAFSLADGRICDLVVLGADEKRTKVPVEAIRTIGKDYIVITRGQKTMDGGDKPVDAPAPQPEVKPDPKPEPVAEAAPPAAPEEAAAPEPVMDEPAPEPVVEEQPKPEKAGNKPETKEDKQGNDELFSEDKPTPALSKYDQKKRDFLVGRKAHRDIKDKDGELIVAKDAPLDDPVINRIIEAGLLGDVFIELTLKK